jgi:hypothetical protein
MEDTNPLSTRYQTDRNQQIHGSHPCFESIRGLQIETRYELHRLQEPRGLLQSVTTPKHSSTKS